MCTHLALPAPQRTAVETYVDVMTAWISGYHAWETETLRYTSALKALPSTGPGYFENILGEPNQVPTPSPRPPTDMPPADTTHPVPGQAGEEAVHRCRRAG